MSEHLRHFDSTGLLPPPEIQCHGGLEYKEAVRVIGGEKSGSDVKTANIRLLIPLRDNT